MSHLVGPRLPTRHVSPRPPGPRDLPPPSLVVLGVLARDLVEAHLAAEAFGALHGGVDLYGAPAPFGKTEYYAAEMGEGLQRFYCSFSSLLPSIHLPELKRQAWDIEQRHLVEGRRAVNLDPGVLDYTKVVLASFKAGPQKLHLGDGIWADLVLYFSEGAYGPLPWTFPDLRKGEHHGFFVAARRRYKELLRGTRQLPQGQPEPRGRGLT